MAFTRDGKLRTKGKPGPVRRRRKPKGPRTNLRRGDAPISLTPLGRWQVQMQRLTDWRARVDNTPTMQGQAWKDGQLRHIDRLIAEHQAAKPDKV